jgi:hypothetical protein
MAERRGDGWLVGWLVGGKWADK